MKTFRLSESWRRQPKARQKRAAFAAVAAAVAQRAPLPDAPRPAGIQHDQVVWVTTPARLDLAGGWTDTPPVSLEGGGSVVNAAVTLNGQYPLQAMAKLNDRFTIRLTSIDLGERVEFRHGAELRDHADPRHWAALPKAALVLAGIAPEAGRGSLARWLKTLGGGLDLTLFSALPKGSGLGSSSILGAAVLACLARVRGETPSLDRLTRMTSVLEQRMGTGGGWQDQVGGIVPGVKWIRTQPGPVQAPRIRSLAFPADWTDRMCLYYTGQKRLARGILENVVWRYLSGDPATRQTLAALRRGASALAEAIAERDYEAFLRGMDGYWTLKKQIDPGATNAGIEAIVEQTRRWAAARVLPGAGGGGFMLFAGASPDAVRRIRRELSRRPIHPQARFFDFSIDSTGLKTAVL